MELDKDFREFIELLNAHEVRYLVVGGYAVNYHGYPRYISDDASEESVGSKSNSDPTFPSPIPAIRPNQQHVP